MISFYLTIIDIIKGYKNVEDTIPDFGEEHSLIKVLFHYYLLLPNKPPQNLVA